MAAGGVPPQAVMVTATQPCCSRSMKGKELCDSHSMNRKEDEPRENQKYSFPNLLGQDQAQTSEGENWTIGIRCY